VLEALCVVLAEVALCVVLAEVVLEALCAVLLAEAVLTVTPKPVDAGNVAVDPPPPFPPGVR